MSPECFLPLHTLILRPDGVFLLPTSEQEILAQYPFTSSVIPSLDFVPCTQDEFPANVAPTNENYLVNNGVIALVEATDENSPGNDMGAIEAVNGDESVDAISVDSVEAASDDHSTVLLKPRLSFSGRHEVLDETTSLQRDVLEPFPTGRSMFLDNLDVTPLFIQSDQSGERKDLDEAVNTLPPLLSFKKPRNHSRRGGPGVVPGVSGLIAIKRRLSSKPATVCREYYILSMLDQPHVMPALGIFADPYDSLPAMVPSLAYSLQSSLSSSGSFAPPSIRVALPGPPSYAFSLPQRRNPQPKNPGPIHVHLLPGLSSPPPINYDLTLPPSTVSHHRPITKHKHVRFASSNVYHPPPALAPSLVYSPQLSLSSSGPLTPPSIPVALPDPSPYAFSLPPRRNPQPKNPSPVHMHSLLGLSSPTINYDITRCPSTVSTHHRPLSKRKHVHFTSSNIIYSPPAPVPSLVYSPQSSLSSSPFTPPSGRVALPGPSPYPFSLPPGRNHQRNNPDPIHMHSLLRLSSPPPINYDITLPPSTISTHHHSLPMRSLSQPATNPPVHSLTIVTQHLPWTIAIPATASANGKFVTVSDVLGAIYRTHRANIPSAEYHSRPSHRGHAQGDVGIQDSVQANSIFQSIRGREVAGHEGDRFPRGSHEVCRTFEDKQWGRCLASEHLMTCLTFILG